MATPQAITDYKRLFDNIISVDMVKELSPDYAATKDSRLQLATALQDAARQFTEKLYNLWVHQAAIPPRQPSVLLLCGGTGSGKTSTYLHSQSPIVKTAQIIVDGTLAKFPEAVQMIDTALKLRKKVTILAVYRDTVDAYQNGVLPRQVQLGRPVPISSHLDSHLGAEQTLPQLEKKYGGRIRVVVIDNSRGPGNARLGDSSLFQRQAA